MNNPQREVMTWEVFGRASRQLARQIAVSPWKPELIICIARGGLVLGGALSYALDMKTIGSINVEFYTGMNDTLAQPRILDPQIEISAELGSRALVVDDVADSGRTLRMVMEMMADGSLRDTKGNPVRYDARSAVLYEKPGTVIKPDYCWRATDKWINFPWSTKPPVNTNE